MQLCLPSQVFFEQLNLRRSLLQVIAWRGQTRSGPIQGMPLLCRVAILSHLTNESPQA